MRRARRFAPSPPDGSTTQSWVVRLLHAYIHTHANKHTHFPSDNKGARRCFHDSELDFTASVLHEKEADIEMVG